MSLRGDSMLNIEINVVRGIMFINLEGELTTSTISKLDNDLNYLLYKQGLNMFVFNFNNLNYIEYGIIETIQNKLIEIFLSCGKVVMCGLREYEKDLIGVYDRLYFVNNERDAFEYLYI